MRLIVNTANSITLRLTSKNKINLSIGTSFKGEDSHEHYQGSYTVNPKVTSQQMLTDDKIMDNNVTINAIYYNAVENPQGGQTVQIGEI